MSWDWLREQEVLRLEQLHALRLLEKVSKEPKPSSSKKDGGKGLGRQRGRGRGRGRGVWPGVGGGDTDVEPESSVDDAPPVPGAPEERAKAGERWGTGHWQLAIVNDRVLGVPKGAGATCNCHHNADDGRTCKKNVTIGRSGLTLAELQLRLKRWLIAGLDSDTWVGDNFQEQHVAMGGRQFLEALSHGLSEEECDRIANALPAVG